VNSHKNILHELKIDVPYIWQSASKIFQLRLLNVLWNKICKIKLVWQVTHF